MVSTIMTPLGAMGIELTALVPTTAAHAEIVAKFAFPTLISPHVAHVTHVAHVAHVAHAPHYPPAAHVLWFALDGQRT